MIKLKNSFTLKVSDETTKKSLYLEVYSIGTDQNESINHVKKIENKSVTFINDCSYSMDSDIRDLRKATKEIYNTIVNDNDVVSGITFASRNDAKDFIKPTFITNKDAQRQVIFDEVDKHLHTYGCTDYMSPLKRYNEVHTPFLRGFYDTIKNHILFFSSDGWPNECTEQEIMDQLSKLDKNISCFYVGFGNYYNRNTFAKMQAITGGNIIHCDDIKSFENEVIAITGGEIKTNVIDKSDLGIYVNDNFVTEYIVDKCGNIIVQNDKNTIKSLTDEYLFVRVLDSERNAKSPKIVEKVSKDDENSMVVGYSSAYVLSKQLHTNDAVLVLNNIVKDVKVTTMLDQARTNDEYNITENYVKDCIVNLDNRFIDGCEKIKKSNLPSELDVVSVLIKHNAMVKPILDNYRGISLKTSQQIPDNCVVAEYNKEGYSKLSKSSISYGSKSEGTMNITLNFTQQGKLKLLNEDQTLLNRLQLDCYKSKSYTLLEMSQNGGRPLKQMEINITEDCLNDLKAINALPKNQKKTEFVLNLSKYPIYKQTEQIKSLDSDVFASCVFSMHRIDILKSYLNYEIKKFDSVKASEFTSEQTDLLKSKYFYTNGYQSFPIVYHESLGNSKPGVKDLESSKTEYEFFYTSDLDVTCKFGKCGKINSKPSLGGATGLKFWESLDKLKGDKSKMNPTQFIIFEYKQEIDKIVSKLDDKAKLSVYESELEKLDNEYFDLETMKSETLLTHIFGKVPFSNQSTRDLEVDTADFNVKMTIGNTKKYYGKYVPIVLES